MQEQLEQNSKTSNKKNSSELKPGMFGALTLLALPMLPFVALIGFVRALDFIAKTDDKDLEDEVKIDE